MSRRGKLEKFTEIRLLDNVFEMVRFDSEQLRVDFDKTIRLKGIWQSHVFKNKNGLVLELACGRGEYSVNMAETYPMYNYIGVDIKGARIWKGAQLAKTKKLDNVAFLRIRIEMLENFFAVGEVDEIWITFPDPFAKKENRRLTSPKFLDLYMNVLSKNGKVHLKTDDDDLFWYSIETVKSHPNLEIKEIIEDVYASQAVHPKLAIKTRYEKQHLENNKTIKYFVFEKND